MIRLFQRDSTAARWSRRLATFAIPLAILTTALHRFDALDTPIAVLLLNVALGIAILALMLAVLGLMGIWRHGGRGTGNAFMGLAFAAALLAWPAWLLSGVFTKPPLNDIVTDWREPPEFAVIGAERPGEAASDLSISEQARAQAEAYPEIVPYFFSQPADVVHSAARTLVEQRGWRIAEDTAPDERDPGRIEAVARTLVFGFRDDVVLRITSRGPAQTRVDMRSASRYGEHDLGTNAHRVYSFLSDLQTFLVEEIDPVGSGSALSEDG